MLQNYLCTVALLHVGSTVEHVLQAVHSSASKGLQEDFWAQQPQPPRQVRLSHGMCRHLPTRSRERPCSRALSPNL